MRERSPCGCRKHLPPLVIAALCGALCSAAACRLPPSGVHRRDAGADSIANRLEASALDRARLREAASPDLTVDPALRARIFEEVNEYLRAEDPGASPPLLAKLDGEYRSVPFAVFVEAVRHRASPAHWPGSGLHQGQWSEPASTSKGSYHAYVPPALSDSSANRFPLLIFLHGAGGSGGAIAGDAQVQRVAERLGAILIAPTSDASCDWSEAEECMAQVVNLVPWLKRRYPVDDSRVVLSGFSMGGRGSFSVGVAYPEPYCGLVPVAGSIGAVFATSDLSAHKKYCCPHVENILPLRLEYISGELDMIQMLYQNRGCELCLKELGNEYVYTELKGQGHVWPIDLWEKAVAWTLARPRPTYPNPVIQNIAVQAEGGLPGYIWLHQNLRVPQYWAYIESRTDAAKPARLQAQLSGSQITLTARNVAQVSLYLSGDLIDLSSSLRVVLGGAGTVLFQGPPKPDARFLLTEARRRGDRTMVFAQRLQLDLAAASP